MRALRELVPKFPNYEKEIRAFKARWPEMIKGPITGTVDILNGLHEKGVPLYALTNWSNETFHFAQALFPFLKFFKDIAISGVEMTKKPDPRFYKILLERNGLNPAKCVFIDDSQVNVHGAQALGLEAIRFESPEQLRSALAKLLGAENIG